MNTPNAPWLKLTGIFRKLSNTPKISMYEAVVNAGKTHSQVNAYEFQGKGTTYAKFIEKIDRTAKAYKALGIKEGETVTICMTAPQGVEQLLCAQPHRRRSGYDTSALCGRRNHVLP